MLTPDELLGDVCSGGDEWFDGAAGLPFVSGSDGRIEEARRVGGVTSMASPPGPGADMSMVGTETHTTRAPIDLLIGIRGMNRSSCWCSVLVIRWAVTGRQQTGGEGGKGQRR